MNEKSPFAIEQFKVLTEVSVFGCSLLDYPEVLNLARLATQELRQSHPDSTPSNVMAEYMSPWKSNFLTPHLDPLIELVAKKIKAACVEFLNTDFKQLNFELMATDCWCAIYEKSNYTKLHSHFPADFSAVIYLDMEEQSSPIVFNETFVVNPPSGTVIFFPSLLPHHVPETHGRRLVVAINYAKYGYTHSN
jgi:hypothetical protein